MKNLFTLIVAFLLCGYAFGQNTGSRISMVATDGKIYLGTITAVQGDKYKIKYDGFAEEAWLTSNQFTLVKANTPAPAVPSQNAGVGQVTINGDNTVSADRPILQCPVQQSQVTAAAKPNLELFKKIIRCRKGEKPASKGYDGAVTVDVSFIQLGTPRKWQYARDIGGGPGITIYPVKVTFTYKTFYRTRTEISENWVRIINFHVNEFGEWVTGSEEPIKAGETRNIPRI